MQQETARGHRMWHLPTSRLIVTYVVLLFTGCSLTPDFKTPESPQVDRYTDDNKSTDLPTSTSQSLTYGGALTGEWWHLYHCDDLDKLIQQALTNNPDLAAAKASLREAHQAVAAAAGGLFPRIDGSAGYSHQKASFVQFGENMAVPSFDLYSLGGTADYSLDVFGDIRAGIAEASALEDVGRDEVAAAYIMLTGSVVAETVALAETEDETAAVNRIIDADRKNLSLLQKSVDRGVLGSQGPEILSLESQLASDENLLPPLLQQRDVAQHGIAALLGEAPSQSKPLDINLSSLTLPHDLPVSLPSELLAQRPDIRAADARLRAANAAIGIAAANLLPHVTLSASFSYNALSLKDLFSPVGLVNSLASEVTTPLFHGGTLLAEKRGAEAAYDAAAAQYQSTVVSAMKQVADILRSLQHDTELAEAEEHALHAAEKTVNSAERSFSTGASSYLTILDARRQLNQAETGYVHAKAQRYADTAQLFVALGGGWWTDPLFPADHDLKSTPIQDLISKEP